MKHYVHCWRLRLAEMTEDGTCDEEDSEVVRTAIALLDRLEPVCSRCAAIEIERRITAEVRTS